MPPRVARRVPAGAGCGRTRVVEEVGVEAPLHGAGRELQRLPSHVRLERLEVELLRRCRGYEPGNLGLDRGDEFLRAGFFLGITYVSAKTK